jgi:hypothetical protein
MGGTRFDARVYGAYATSTAHLDHTTKFTAGTMKSHADPRKSFDPKTIKVRESVKSDLNPNPTPVIVGLDVTGSMGPVVDAMHRSLGVLFEEIIKRDPVSDPHVLAMAIGDMDCDRSPVQATQFEADPVTIGKQVEELHLERGGGGNDHESYLGPLYFALMRTKCDAFADNRKGYIFTIGDEQPQMVLTKQQIETWFGDQPKQDYTAAELLAAVERNWHVFHIMVMEGSHVSSHYGLGNLDRTRKEWRELMGQHVIELADHTKMAETIISIIEVTEGRDKDSVVHSWSGDTSLVVQDAIKDLTAANKAATGPVAL